MIGIDHKTSLGRVLGMKRKILWAVWPLALACAVGVANAQLGQATPEELSRTGNGPGPVPGNRPPGAVAAPSVPPSADPRDFSGTWRMAGGPGGGPPGPGPRPPGAPGPGGPPPGFVEQKLPPGALSDRILCLPQPGPTIGVDGPLLLIQTRQQITWVAEEMHHLRRIYLTGEPSKNLKPSFLGEAFGRWDGNTLVVETGSLKRLQPGAKMVERWTKSADGSRIDMTITDVDASGAPLGKARSQALVWRPGQQVLEWICEDNNDEWLPGGSEYTPPPASGSEATR
jgi:hypothetical protein